MKRFSLAFVILFAALASTSFAASKQVTVTIHHQTIGCHTWAVGHGVDGVVRRVTVTRGTTLVFVNNDVMPQRIVQKYGSHLTFLGRTNLSKPAASVKVALLKPGIYKFGTVAGEDYYKGIKTVGEDNVLKLVVTVT
jgi:hypothetical protein